MAMEQIGIIGGKGIAYYWHLKKDEQEPWFHIRRMTPHE